MLIRLKKLLALSLHTSRGFFKPKPEAKPLDVYKIGPWANVRKMFCTAIFYEENIAVRFLGAKKKK